jgi:predicted Zn-dependent peptidase
VTQAIRAELDRLKTQDVPAEELQAVKTRVKAQLIRQLDNNSGLALQLATYQTLFGDWRELFRSVDKIDKVTAADIRRVANATFVSSNRTIAYIDTSKPAATGGTQ